MKDSLQSSQLLASEVALDLIDRTRVQSAYDSFGNLSHLVATVPRNEFFKLYPKHTTASIFIQNKWLQFCLSGKSPTVVSRISGAQIRIILAQDEWGSTVLKFVHCSEILIERKLRGSLAELIFISSEGLQYLAKAAVKAFAKIESQATYIAPRSKNFPCVHVLPESCHGDGFSAEFVNLQ